MKSSTKKTLIIGSVVALAFLAKERFGAVESQGEGEIGGTDEPNEGNYGEIPSTPVQPVIPQESVEESFIIPQEVSQDEPVARLENVQSDYIPASFGEPATYDEPKIEDEAPLSDELAGLGLGVASLVPSSISKVGENIVDNIKGKPKNIFQKVGTESVEEVPLLGKTLSKQLAKVTPDAGEAVGKSLLKKGVKKTAELGLKSIPLAGIGAGIVFDTKLNNKGVVEASIANVAGDVVGGALGVVTAPLALTGIGTAVPIALSVGGQVATESVVYGVSDFFKNRKSSSQTDKTKPLQNKPISEEQVEQITSGIILSKISKGDSQSEEKNEKNNNFPSIFNKQANNQPTSELKNKKDSSSKSSKTKAKKFFTQQTKIASKTPVGTVTSSKTSKSRTNSAVTVTRQKGNFGKSKYTGNTIKRRIIIKKPKRGSRKITYTKK